MMAKKVLIFSNNTTQTQELKKKLLKKLAVSDIEVVQDDATPDFIISIGGDGTLLRAFHRYQHFLSEASFIGIHTGHLGFYTDWQGFELDDVIQGIQESKGESVSYPLIQIELLLEDGTKKNYLALNEFAIRSFSGTMVCEIYIKEHFFETIRGDGVCIATPTGSTGLNKSLGGAVIHPRLDAIQLTEMASVNNRVYRTLSSPIIIPRDEWFVLHPSSEEKQIGWMVDNITYNNLDVKEVRVQIASERIRFASFRHMHYWDRVENSFIGRKQRENQEHTSPNLNFLK